MLASAEGILFLAALLLLLGLVAVDGEASRCLAILPLAVVGTWRQPRTRQTVLLAEGLLWRAGGGRYGSAASRSSRPPGAT